MTNITKPIGKRNRLVSKEEAKAMLERVEIVEKVEERVEETVEDKVMEEKNPPYIESRALHGKLIEISEYKVLENIAAKLNKSFWQYFHNFNDGRKDVYLEIENNHVVRLDLYNQDLNEIPEELCKLTKLRHLQLGKNNIKKIEHLDKLEELEELYIYGNKIDYKNSHNAQEWDKLVQRNIKILRE